MIPFASNSGKVRKSFDCKGAQSTLMEMFYIMFDISISIIIHHYYNSQIEYVKLVGFIACKLYFNKAD